MEERLQKLERRCRHLTVAFGLSLATLGLVTLMGAQKKSGPLEKLEVQSLSIVDPDGKPRITLEADEVRGTFSMLTSNGDALLETECSDELFEQVIYDNNKKIRITLGMAGATNTTAMRFYDSKENQRLSIFSGLKDDFQFHLIDEKNRPFIDIFNVK